MISIDSVPKFSSRCYFAKKHGLTRQQAQDLIKKHGSNRKELDAAAERLKGGGQ